MNKQPSESPLFWPEQLSFDLPVTADEAKPWLVSIHRHYWETKYPFLTRFEAIEFMVRSFDEDCYVDNLYRPDGSIDERARDEAMKAALD